MYYETLVPAAIGDVGRDGVDPVEGIEEANGRTGAGVGRRGDLKQAVVAMADATSRKRRARDVAGEPLELLTITGRDGLSSKNRKTGMDP